MELLADPINDQLHLIGDHVSVWRYVGAVAEAVGVGVESVTIDQDGPVSAYIAVDARSAMCPHQPLALLWAENAGWSVAIEAGARLTRIAHLTAGGAHPDPSLVRDFLHSVTEDFVPSVPSAA
jgi:hypothetical protein